MAQRPREHAHAQDLVAEPTIFSEGVLIGSKAVRLYALDAATGTPHYFQDTSSADCADAACAVGGSLDAAVNAAHQHVGARETDESASLFSEAVGEEARRRAAAGRSRRAQILVSRSDYSLRVLERHGGRQRWNVSLAQFSLEVRAAPGGALAYLQSPLPPLAGAHSRRGRKSEFTPRRASVKSAQVVGGEMGWADRPLGVPPLAGLPPRRLALELHGGHALCASPTAAAMGDGSIISDGGSSRQRGGKGGDGGGSGGGDGCEWSRTFNSPPVVLYHLDTSSGSHQQLSFTPHPAAFSRLAASESAEPDTWEDDGTAAGAVRGALSTSLAQGSVWNLEQLGIMQLTLPQPQLDPRWFISAHEGAIEREARMAVAVAAANSHLPSGYVYTNGQYLSADALAMAAASQRSSPLLPLMPYLSTLRPVRYLALPGGAELDDEADSSTVAALPPSGVQYTSASVLYGAEASDDGRRLGGTVRMGDLYADSKTRACTRAQFGA